MTAPVKPLRADAERNRQRILDAAGALFAERGLEVSMEDIAAAAGVGVGTLYRRFGDRHALIDALFEQKAERIAGIAEQAFAMDDAWDGLEFFMRSVCRINASDRGLKEVLMSTDHGTEVLHRTRARIRPIAERLVNRAKDAGVLREDVDTFDIPMMNFAVGYIADVTRCEAPDFYERILTVILDGLRHGRTPLPAAPLNEEKFVRSLTRR